jgi:hypothetical protein
MTKAPDQETACDPDFWTIKEVAEHYRTTVPTLRYWRQHNYGPRGTRVGNRLLYPRGEIGRFDREVTELAATGAGEAP